MTQITEGNTMYFLNIILVVEKKIIKEQNSYLPLTMQWAFCPADINKGFLALIVVSIKIFMDYFSINEFVFTENGISKLNPIFTF